ncbi:MAG: TIGR03905 family TSCPD domain-containing protein [Erysipelotrichaceae bacterium]
MKFDYIPKGVCSRKYTFDIEDNIIRDVEIIGGCPGNLAGIRKLIIGMDIDEVIKRLSGITCGFKKTSCPDQISKALAKFKEK